MAAAVALLGACTTHHNVDNSKKGSLDTSAVVERVEEIYTTVFNVYNEEDSLRNLDIHMENGVYERRADFEANFCSDEWNTLLKKVNEIDSLYHQNEMGFWDFDYWIMGQDWHKLSISDVKFVERIGSWAEVDLKLHNFDKINSKLYAEVGLVEEEIRSLDKKSANILKELRISIHDFVRKDRQIIKGKRGN